MNIIHEDNHLLVVDKPADLATMGAESGVPSVHSMAADYLRHKYNKPGRVFVGIVSRLDAMTTGVLCLARTSKAASRLTPQFAEKSGDGAVKIYLATVQGHLDADRGKLVGWVRKDDQARRMRVVGAGASGAQEASLRYQVVGRTDDSTVVAVRLISGRKHQIRVQFAAAGHPVIGDRKYDSARPFSSGVALHSWRLQIEHPTLKRKQWFTAQPPRSWKPYAEAIGSTRELWTQIRVAFNIQDDVPPDPR